MSKIESVRAQEILDSRGFPTVGAEVSLADELIEDDLPNSDSS